MTIPCKVFAGTKLRTDHASRAKREGQHAGDAPTFQPDRSVFHLICAEDDEANREVLRTMLNSLGYESTFVHNGHELIEAIKQNDYGAILMDVYMPRTDGLEATRLIREGAGGEQNRNINIVGITAFNTGDAKARCLDAGMNYFMDKPIKRNVLDRTLEQVKEALHDNGSQE